MVRFQREERTAALGHFQTLDNRAYVYIAHGPNFGATAGTHATAVWSAPFPEPRAGPALS
jgi:hypothetical protein